MYRQTVKFISFVFLSIFPSRCSSFVCFLPTSFLTYLFTYLLIYLLTYLLTCSTLSIPRTLSAPPPPFRPVSNLLYLLTYLLTYLLSLSLPTPRTSTLLSGPSRTGQNVFGRFRQRRDRVRPCDQGGNCIQPQLLSMVKTHHCEHTLLRQTPY